MRATRPSGCVCLGLGGAILPGKTFAVAWPGADGTLFWGYWCTACPEGWAIQAATEADRVAGQRERAAEAELARAAAIRDALAQSGLHPKLLRHAWADFTDKPKPAARLRQLRPGVADQRGVILLGGAEENFGTGKTTLVSLALRDWIAAGGGGLFVSVAEWLDWARPLEEGHGTRGPAERALSVGLLVLDDLGAEALTAWGREQLFRLLEHRKRRDHPTLWTSNYALGRLSARLVERDHGDPIEGRRLVERIIETCDVLVIEGRNYRLGGG